LYLILEILMRKISSREMSNEKYAQVGGPDTVFLILTRIANGARVSSRMLSALRGFIVTDPSAVVSAIGRVSNLPGLIANSSVIPELAPLLSGAGSSTAATTGLAGVGGTVGTGSVAGGGAATTGAATVGGGGAATVGGGGAATVGGGGAATAGGGGAATVGGGGAATVGGGGAATAAGLSGLTLGTIAVGVPLIIATPWLIEKYFGSRSEIKTKSELETASIAKAEEVFEPIWTHDVTTTFNPWADTLWSDTKGGDLGDIVGEQKNNIILLTLRSALRGEIDNVSSKSILDQLENTGIAERSDMENDSGLMKDVNAASNFFTAMAKDILLAADIAKKQGKAPPISGRGGSDPSATSDSGYESSSLIMKERGYLKSVQSSWTPEFDAAFRAFIDAGTAKGAVPTNLVGGQEWSDVAGPLGFSPNKSGAFSAIISLAGLVDKKTSTPTTGVATPAPSEAPASTTPVAAGDNPVLAAIIGAMYNQKLVGTPGFDLIREPKRIRALIESAPVGGPNPTGYGNAARIIMKMNPSIGGMLPAKLTGPVDDKFAKNPANKSLLQAIQVAINGIYESAIPTLVKPGLERSRELIARYLNSAAGGNWTVKPASNSADQWVKLASERKMRIRAEIAAEMTPAEMAAARRIKMREI
jgi:hypothetical protein